MQNAMFGRPEWFKTRTISYRTPASFMGWLYLFGWGAAISIPTWMFLDARRAPEGLAWLAVASLAFLWDRRHSHKSVANSAVLPTQAATERTPDGIQIVPAEVQRDVPKPTPSTTESPFYISDAPADITFVAERNRKPSRTWMPWARRFRV
jgi:hypothetical protein